jgi:membrane-bound lytic murein transglycosylase B
MVKSALSEATDDVLHRLEAKKVELERSVEGADPAMKIVGIVRNQINTLTTAVDQYRATRNIHDDRVQKGVALLDADHDRIDTIWRRDRNDGGHQHFAANSAA